MKTAAPAAPVKPARRTLAQQPDFDNAILEAARAFIADHRYPPTVRELRDIVGASSTSVVNHAIYRLESKGHLTTRKGQSRTMVLLGDEQEAL